MINKLRRRMVMLIMLVVFLSICTIFTILYVSTAQNLADEGLNVIENILIDPRAYNRPDKAKDQVNMPFFSVKINSANEVAVEQSYYYTVDDQTLLDIVSEAYNSGDKKGVLENYALRYEIRHLPELTRIAFVDTSFERSTLNNLLLDFLLIGAGILAAFFLLSFLISRRMVKPVEQAWRQQKQFVADASHELKTPLAVIKANAELLSGEDAETDPEQRKCRVENIREESVRMGTLVENLLDQARADAAENVESFHPVELSYIVDESVLHFEPVVFECGKSIESDITPDITVSGNAEQLRQLAAILIDNAQKYAYADTTILVTLKQPSKKEVQLIVSDTGPDIPPEDTEKIFDRFYRSDKARQANGSYGLGLSIAKSIVQAHRGSINVHSEGGQTAFTVTLPVEKHKSVATKV